MDGDDRQSPVSPEKKEEEEDVVMSEIHLGCPPKFSGSFVSHFTFSLPPEVEYIEGKYEYQVLDESKRHQEVILDDDGDLALPRRNKQRKGTFDVAIQHNITSSIPKVGLQVWRAELVLSDFVLHKMFTSSEFDGIVAIELGAGTGLVGMLLARVAKTVFLTGTLAYTPSLIMELRYLKIVLAMFVSIRHCYPLKLRSMYGSLIGWLRGPLIVHLVTEFEALKQASLLVAADVIYSDDLTDAFFHTLERLMSHGLEKVLYLALEKRYNFSIDDLDVVANGYSRFRHYVKDKTEDAKNNGIQNGCLSSFVGTRIDLTEILQYAINYNRRHDLELWKIKYVRLEEEPII